MHVFFFELQSVWHVAPVVNGSTLVLVTDCQGANSTNQIAELSATNSYIGLTC